MNDKRKHLGISDMLPPRARDILLRAATTARALPEESVARRAIIDDAIAQAKAECPEAFRVRKSQVREDRGTGQPVSPLHRPRD